MVYDECMKIKKTASAQKQMAYAKNRIFTKMNKQESALAAGYGRDVAETPKSKIEDHMGFQNAVSELSIKSNTLALDIMKEFETRGLSEFSDKNLIAALNAIGAAWARFNAPMHHHKDNGLDYDNGKNPLRTVILQTVNNQTITNPENIRDAVVNEGVVEEESNPDDLGF